MISPRGPTRSSVSSSPVGPSGADTCGADGSGGVRLVRRGLVQLGDGGALVLGDRCGRQGDEAGVVRHRVPVSREDAPAELVDLRERGARGEAAVRAEPDGGVVAVLRVDVADDHLAGGQGHRDLDGDPSGDGVAQDAVLDGHVGADVGGDVGCAEDHGEVGGSLLVERGCRCDAGAELFERLPVLFLEVVQLYLRHGFGGAATDHNWTSRSCLLTAPI